MVAAIAVGLGYPPLRSGGGSLLRRWLGAAVSGLLRAWSGPLALALAPEGEAVRTARAINPGFVPVHIPVRGSFVHVAPR
jgi:hypothetical protein